MLIYKITSITIIKSLVTVIKKSNQLYAVEYTVTLRKLVMEKIMSYCVLFCQAAHHVLNLKLDILVIRKLQQICSKEKILF